MSKLLENKQMVHIAAEVIILIGITFYFSQKNRRLMGHIEDLTHRMEEQDDVIDKHEKILQRLVKHATNSSTPVKSVVTAKLNPSLPVEQKPSDQQLKEPLKDVPVHEAESKIDEVDSESDTSDDLDKELVDELRELEENKHDDVIEIDTDLLRK
jgi:hypothetical protein